MTADTEPLDLADACHDTEPARAAEWLRQVEPLRLPAERRARYAFLINHVLGEKLAAWDEALARQRQLLAGSAQDDAALVPWRQLGAAALAAGADDEAARAAGALATASGATPERARDLLALAAAMYLVPGQDGSTAAQTALAALSALTDDAWPTATTLDAQAAACTNNLANGLLDKPAAQLRHGALRAALTRSAEQAQRLWQHAGTWVQHERALYLRALACTALGEPHRVRRHALDGLAVLDAHDKEHAESVDRAFFELERWNACAWLGLVDEAEAALAKARALAASFDDAGLTDWFEARRAQLPGLRGG